MLSRTSVSEQILAQIAKNGSTWGDLCRESPDLRHEQLEFALKGLLRAGLVRRVAEGEVGIWWRVEDVPPQPEDGQYMSLKKQRIPAKYNDDGWRWCNHCCNYHPVTSFQADRHNGDGLASWCRPCKIDANRAYRALRGRKSTRRTAQEAPGAAIDQKTSTGASGLDL